MSVECRAPCISILISHDSVPSYTLSSSICSSHSTSFFFFPPSSSTCGFSTSSLYSGGKGRGWRKEDEDRKTVYLWKPVQRITAFLHRSYEKRERVCDGGGGGG